ncbi:MAG: hypothetical protein Q7R45_02460 [Sulfuricaulis sp.]|nr:hypothetical protein [Sulfuricaulis sp.]
MKNITLSVPDDVYETAANAAAERATSVDSLIAALLGQLERRVIAPASHSAAVGELFAALDAARNTSPVGGLRREEIYDRPIFRRL